MHFLLKAVVMEAVSWHGIYILLHFKMSEIQRLITPQEPDMDTLSHLMQIL